MELYCFTHSLLSFRNATWQIEGISRVTTTSTLDHNKILSHDALSCPLMIERLHQVPLILHIARGLPHEALMQIEALRRCILLMDIRATVRIALLAQPSLQIGE